ncbi:hypothetical protein Q5752_004280 [Cryptotrichosporon argae]
MPTASTELGVLIHRTIYRDAEGRVRNGFDVRQWTKDKSSLLPLPHHCMDFLKLPSDATAIEKDQLPARERIEPDLVSARDMARRGEAWNRFLINTSRKISVHEADTAGSPAQAAAAARLAELRDAQSSLQAVCNAVRHCSAVIGKELLSTDFDPYLDICETSYKKAHDAFESDLTRGEALVRAAIQVVVSAACWHEVMAPAAEIATTLGVPGYRYNAQGQRLEPSALEAQAREWAQRRSRLRTESDVETINTVLSLREVLPDKLGRGGGHVPVLRLTRDGGDANLGQTRGRAPSAYVVVEGPALAWAGAANFKGIYDKLDAETELAIDWLAPYTRLRPLDNSRLFCDPDMSVASPQQEDAATVLQAAKRLTDKTNATSEAWTKAKRRWAQGSASRAELQPTWKRLLTLTAHEAALAGLILSRLTPEWTRSTKEAEKQLREGFESAWALAEPAPDAKQNLERLLYIAGQRTNRAMLDLAKAAYLLTHDTAQGEDPRALQEQLSAAVSATKDVSWNSQMGHRDPYTWLDDIKSSRNPATDLELEDTQKHLDQMRLSRDAPVAKKGKKRNKGKTTAAGSKFSERTLAAPAESSASSAGTGRLHVKPAPFSETLSDLTNVSTTDKWTKVARQRPAVHRPTASKRRQKAASSQASTDVVAQEKPMSNRLDEHGALASPSATASAGPSSLVRPHRSYAAILRGDPEQLQAAISYFETSIERDGLTDSNDAASDATLDAATDAATDAASDTASASGAPGGVASADGAGAEQAVAILMPTAPLQFSVEEAYDWLGHAGVDGDTRDYIAGLWLLKDAPRPTSKIRRVNSDPELGVADQAGSFWNG